MKFILLGDTCSAFFLQKRLPLYGSHGDPGQTVLPAVEKEPELEPEHAVVEQTVQKTKRRVKAGTVANRNVRASIGDSLTIIYSLGLSQNNNHWHDIISIL